MAHEEIIWETLQNNFISTNNLQKNNFYDLTCNFGQVQKHVQHSRFSVCERYIFSPHLLISWHTYGHHIYLCHDTYKCNFWTWTANNRSKYILVSQKSTMMHTLHINCFGCKWPMKKTISETLKNYVTSNNNAKKRNLHNWIWNLGQLQNIYNTTGFLY